MERYRILTSIKKTHQATTYRAITRATGQLVAIKQLSKRFQSWQDCLAIRQVRTLRKLSHQNLVKLIQVIRVKDQLFLVYQLLKNTLQTVSKQKLTESQIRTYIFQLLKGLSYIHRKGFFHRDLKPQTILIQGNHCKISEFGHLKQTQDFPHTLNTSSRWYRAPQVLLGANNYNPSVDLFAVGCIMIQLYSQKPLAAGTNDRDQLVKMCSVLGSPDHWKWALQRARDLRFFFPKCPPVPIEILAPGASQDACLLMGELLQWNPQFRPQAVKCLKFPYFRLKRAEKVLKTPSVKFQQGLELIGRESSKGRWNTMPIREFQLPSFNKEVQFRNRLHPLKMVKRNVVKQTFLKKASPWLFPKAIAQADRKMIENEMMKIKREKPSSFLKSIEPLMKNQSKFKLKRKILPGIIKCRF